MRTQGFLFALMIMAVFMVPVEYAQGAGTITGNVKVAGARNSADVVVYVEAPGKNLPGTKKHAVMDQVDQTFIPHVLPILKGTMVDFPNSDKVRHNVYSPAGGASPFNLGTYPAGVSKTMDFEKPGVVPL
ncbi:MAG: methylamine utilization protein, partial [Acidobacteria bacterium]|nr:methylamine utilization protein [Acidobacteriota bacterium]